MAVDYVAWIEDALRRKPHLSQAGLARHLGRDKSVISMIRRGTRRLKADEISIVADYLGESPPTEDVVGTSYAPVVGRVGAAWYEPKQIPMSAGKVAPILDWMHLRQEAYVVDTRVMDIPEHSVLVVTPIKEIGTGRAKAGDLVVIKRTLAHLQNLTLARFGETQDEVLALVLEVRMTVYWP